MAWLWTRETFNRRSASADDEQTREYTRTFDLYFSYRAEDPAFVRLAPGLPRVWNPYVTPEGVFDLGSWVRRVEVAQDTQDPFLWRAEVRYSSKVERPDVFQVENPLLRPAEISWDTATVMVPMEFDAEGRAVLNSAGERFDPPLEREDDRLVLTVVQNQSAFAALNVLNYKGRTNSKTWLGFPRGQARNTKIQAARAFENGVLFWRVTFEFQIRFALFEGQDPVTFWAERVLDRGFFTKDANGKLRVATDPLGKAVTKEVLLNGSGGRLAPGAAPVFGTYYRYREADFNELSLLV